MSRKKKQYVVGLNFDAGLWRFAKSHHAHDDKSQSFEVVKQVKEACHYPDDLDAQLGVMQARERCPAQEYNHRLDLAFSDWAWYEVVDGRYIKLMPCGGRYS